MTQEQIEIASAAIVIDDSEYKVGDLHLLTNKENPEEKYFCTKEKIGTYDDYIYTEDGGYYSTSNVYGYNDVKTNTIIATSYNYWFSFSSASKKKYSKDEQKGIKKLGKRHVIIQELYNAIDHETVLEKDFVLTEKDIIDNSVKQKTKSNNK